MGRNCENGSWAGKRYPKLLPSLGESVRFNGVHGAAVPNEHAWNCCEVHILKCIGGGIHNLYRYLCECCRGVRA